MYPDLSYIFADLFGTSVDNGFSLIKTFGLLLVCAFLISAIILSSELKRKEKLGLLPVLSVKVKANQIKWSEIITNTILVFILAYKLPYLVQHLDLLKANPSNTILSKEGNLLIGILGAVITALWLYIKKQQIESQSPIVTKLIRPHERVPDIAMMAAVFGVLGAKLFVIIESKEAFNKFLADPIHSLFSGSGLAIYGGLIVAFTVIYFYVKKIKLKPIHVIDAAAPALIIGYAMGRLGCQLAGDGDWGIVNTLAMPSWWFLPDWVWAFDYPHTVLKYINPETGNHLIHIPDCSGYITANGEVPIYCKKLANAVFPTPIYETVAALGIFSILWSLRKRVAIPGMIFFIYCVFNGFERFLIEKIRVNEKLDFFGFKATQAEIISTTLFFIGLAGCWYVWQKHKDRNSGGVVHS